MSSTVVPSIAPWLAVRDAQKAVAFYKAGFGAVELYRLPADDGSLAVAQLSVGGAVFWVQNDSNASPAGRGGAAVRMILSVDDPDAVFEQVIAAGAAVVAPIEALPVVLAPAAPPVSSPAPVAAPSRQGVRHTYPHTEEPDWCVPHTLLG